MIDRNDRQAAPSPRGGRFGMSKRSKSIKGRYRWWNRHRCPHSALRGIFGDEINAVGGYRLRCLDCGRHVDGPVILARMREIEDDEWEI